MVHSREEQFEQDRIGNVRRKLDTLRAQEGMAGLDTDEGIANIGSAETATDVLLLSKPTHAQRMIGVQIQAFNSVGSGANTFTLKQATLNGSNSITSTTQRSVPIEVASGATRILEYKGIPFDRAISVESEFQGQIGIAVISDHHEENEPASEITESP